MDRQWIDGVNVVQYKGDGIAGRGPALGVATIRVDGNDVWAVYAAVKAAREYILHESAPCLVEFLSYRGHHHSTSDDSSKYRATDTHSSMMEVNNPIERLRRFNEERGWWTEALEQSLREETRLEVLQSIERSEVKLKPKVEEMFEDVYDEVPAALQEQAEQLRAHVSKYPEHYQLSSYTQS
mmetsp:Transcript_52765/g.114571  ORF Transcript_52765/g.114571 Transcript_52765/m.114571 type:complete len:182 (+) Transcript_52765:209-754(+)